MAIAFDNATDMGTTTGATLTHSHIATGSNLLLIVATSYSNSTDSVTGVTWNGVAMTTNGSLKSAFEGTAYDCKIWYLYGAASGTHNVVVSQNGASSIYAVAVSYANVFSGAVDNQATAVSTNATFTQSLTPNANNCWVLMGGNCSGGNSTAGANTTNRISTAPGMFFCDNNANVPTPASTTLNEANGGGHWSGVIFSISSNQYTGTLSEVSTEIESLTSVFGYIRTLSEVSTSTEGLKGRYGFTKQTKHNSTWTEQQKS